MIELLLRVGIILTALVISQAFFNTFLYRQPRNWGKILIVTIAVIATWLTAILCWILVNFLPKFPVLGNIVGFIDAPFKAFYDYLPKILGIIWFVLPIVVVWIIFLIKGGVAYRKIRKAYFDFIEKHGTAISSEPDVVVANDESTNEVSKSPEAKIQDSEEHIPKLIFDSELPPQKYFLDGKVKTVPFEHRTVKGIAKALPLAKTELLLGKTLDGYVGIYESRKGYRQLQKLFSENSIDITNVKASPSIVFFTSKKVKSMGLKEYVMKLRQVKRNDS